MIPFVVRVPTFRATLPALSVTLVAPLRVKLLLPPAILRTAALAPAVTNDLLSSTMAPPEPPEPPELPAPLDCKIVPSGSTSDQLTCTCPGNENVGITAADARTCAVLLTKST